MSTPRQYPAFPDAEIYDPITEKTYSGHQTYAEQGVNYSEFFDLVQRGEVLCYVHKICIPRSVMLTKGHPYIIRSTSSDVQLFGILVSFQSEPTKPVIISAEYGATGEEDKLTYSWEHYQYHLVFSKVSPLDFLEVVEGVRNLYEHKIKKASPKSSS